MFRLRISQACLFNTETLRNPAQFTAQFKFVPTQFASKIPHNFHFFPAPCQKPKTCSGSMGLEA